MDSLAKSLMADTVTKTRISKKWVQKVCLLYFKVAVPNVCAEKFILNFIVNTTKVCGDHYREPKVKVYEYCDSYYYSFASQ